MLRDYFLSDPQVSFLLDQQKIASALSKLSWDHAGVSWTTLDSPYPPPTSLSYFLHDIWGENPPSLVGQDRSLEKGPKYIRSDQEGMGGTSFSGCWDTDRSQEG